MENNTEQEVLNEEIINQPKLLGAIDKILIKRSIARRVSDIQDLKGPIGIISGAQWTYTSEESGGRLEVVKDTLEAVSRTIKTEFTIESLEDLKSIYGEDMYDLLAHYIVDEMAYQLDKDFIEMVKERAENKASLVFDSTYDGDLYSVGQSIAIRTIKGLSDLPISDNRSPQGWAIVSSDVAAVLALTTNVIEDLPGDENNIDNSPSYIGSLGGIDFYVDYTHPNTSIDAVVFGIKGNGFSKGSTIFSPYKKTWLDAVDSTSGDLRYFLLDRTGMAINPLDKKYYDDSGVSGFLGKIDIDLSGLSVYSS